jgi:hypothetical protein
MRSPLAIVHIRSDHDSLGTDHVYCARDSFWIHALAAEDRDRAIAGGFYAARTGAGVFVSFYVYGCFVGFVVVDCSGFLGFFALRRGFCV